MATSDLTTPPLPADQASADPASGTSASGDQASDRWFAGTLLRIVAGADDTGGQLAVMEQVARRGFSPPLHVHHREDTAMLVVEGRLTVLVGTDERVVEDGGFVWLPRDVPHTFRVDSDLVRLVELVTPAGFEQFHVDASDPAASPELPPPGPPDVGRLVAAIGRYDAEIIGPPLSAVADGG